MSEKSDYLSRRNRILQRDKELSERLRSKRPLYPKLKENNASDAFEFLQRRNHQSARSNEIPRPRSILKTPAYSRDDPLSDVSSTPLLRRSGMLKSGPSRTRSLPASRVSKPRRRPPPGESKLWRALSSLGSRLLPGGEEEVTRMNTYKNSQIPDPPPEKLTEQPLDQRSESQKVRDLEEEVQELKRLRENDQLKLRAEREKFDLERESVLGQLEKERQEIQRSRDDLNRQKDEFLDKLINKEIRELKSDNTNDELLELKRLSKKLDFYADDVPSRRSRPPDSPSKLHRLEDHVQKLTQQLDAQRVKSEKLESRLMHEKPQQENVEKLVHLYTSGKNKVDPDLSLSPINFNYPRRHKSPRI